jgi:hypothetical protein
VSCCNTGRAKRRKYGGVGAKNRKVGKARTYRRQVRSLTAHNWHISHASQYKVQVFIVEFYGVKASDIKQYGKTLLSKQWCQFHNQSANATCIPMELAILQLTSQRHTNRAKVIRQTLRRLLGLRPLSVCTSIIDFKFPLTTSCVFGS